MGNRTVNKEDSLLWARFLSGDDEAYACIYKRYIQVLFSSALQYTTDKELIKDCIQDVFEKLYKNRDKIKSTDNVKAYLFVILRNSLINALQKEQTYIQYVGKIETRVEETPVDHLEKAEEDRSAQDKIQQIFHVLTPMQKEIIYYRYVEGLDIKDIALIVGMNYQSVQNFIQRSLKKVRRIFVSSNFFW